MCSKDVVKVLTSDGWVYTRQRGSHAIYKKEGISDIVCIPIHGSKSVSIGVLKQTERITGLSFRR